jgi:hypothetical protein
MCCEKTGISVLTGVKEVTMSVLIQLYALPQVGLFVRGDKNHTRSFASFDSILGHRLGYFCRGSEPRRSDYFAMGRKQGKRICAPPQGQDLGR